MSDELKQALKKFFYDRGGKSDPNEREAFRGVLKASIKKASEAYVMLKIRQVSIEPELRRETFDTIQSGMDEHIESISYAATQAVEAKFDELLDRLYHHPPDSGVADLDKLVEDVYRETIGGHDEFFSEFVDKHIKRARGEE